MALVFFAFRGRLQPALVVIDDPGGIRGNSRESAAIPVLPAPEAPPVATGGDRTIGKTRRRVTHGTRHNFQGARFISREHSCRVRLERTLSHELNGTSGNRRINDRRSGETRAANPDASVRETE